MRVVTMDVSSVRQAPDDERLPAEHEAQVTQPKTMKFIASLAGTTCALNRGVDNTHPLPRGQRCAVARSLVLLILASTPASADVISARASDIESGNTLTLLGGEKIQLYGIEAPDVRQQCKQDGVCVPCGRTSRDALAAVALGELTCTRKGTVFGKTIAQCSSGGIDVSQKMLEIGQAIIYRKNLKRGETLPVMYAIGMARAKSDKTGLWAGTMIKPWYWRHAGRRLACERQSGL